MFKYTNPHIGLTLIGALLFVLPIKSSGESGEKDFKKIFTEANYFYYREDYKDALSLFKQLYKENQDNANINYKIGNCFLNISNLPNEKAIPYLEKAVKNITKNYKEGSYREEAAPVDAYFYLGKAYHVNNKLEKAKATYKKYKDLINVEDIATIDFVNKQIEACNTAKELMNNPVQCKKILLNDSLNLPPESFNLLISGDGNTMVFMTHEPFYDAIQYAKKENGKWNAPRNIMFDLGIDDKFYVTSISFNGDKMFLYEDNTFNRDLFYSEFKEEQWTKVKAIDDGNINTKYWESHPYISPSGDFLYFVSNRPGGMGASDIYKSPKLKERWGTPVNLGTPINSSFNEDSPFLSKDEKIIYFSSQGHVNMGGYDIFYSTFTDSSWSEPLNIGYPINSTDDDLFYVPVNNGSKGYQAELSSKGNLNIFQYNIGESDVELITIKGKITLDDNETDFTSFSVIFINSANDTVAIDTSIENGEYSQQVVRDKYKIVISGDDYTTKTINVVPSENKEQDIFASNVTLKPKEITSGDYLSIKILLFDYGEDELNRESKIELERIYNYLKENPSLHLEVTGFTDSHGPSEYNRALSIKRSESVINYLKNKGISPERFVLSGKGEDENIAINQNPDGTDNPTGRKYNRRVELKVLKSKDNTRIKHIADIPEQTKTNNYELYTVFLSKSKIKLLESQVKGLINSKHEIMLHKINNDYIYTVGIFFKKSQAMDLLNKVIDMGFSDAEIVNKGEYTKLTSSNLDQNLESQYTIQLGKAKNLSNVSKCLHLGTISVHYGVDGFYRCLMGDYINLSEAQQILNQLIRLGFKDALIINKNSLVGSERKFIDDDYIKY
jgi:outer membrane protein OmpA-like peptidoglycan-associated protein